MALRREQGGENSALSTKLFLCYGAESVLKVKAFRSAENPQYVFTFEKWFNFPFPKVSTCLLQEDQIFLFIYSVDATSSRKQMHEIQKFLFRKKNFLPLVLFMKITSFH